MSPFNSWKKSPALSNKDTMRFLLSVVKNMLSVCLLFKFEFLSLETKGEVSREDGMGSRQGLCSCVQYFTAKRQPGNRLDPGEEGARRNQAFLVHAGNTGSNSLLQHSPQPKTNLFSCGAKYK